MACVRVCVGVKCAIVRSRSRTWCHAERIMIDVIVVVIVVTAVVMG
jgi:hypothetical protein